MKNNNVLKLIAFVALVIFAVLEIISIFEHFNIIVLSGGILIALLNTVKNLCILFVVGMCAYSYTEGKSKGVRITYWVSLGILILCTLLMWI